MHVHGRTSPSRRAAGDGDEGGTEYSGTRVGEGTGDGMGVNGCTLGDECGSTVTSRPLDCLGAQLTHESRKIRIRYGVMMRSRFSGASKCLVE
jgi:hypothetical protein